jgi:hypothetical protein
MWFANKYDKDPNSTRFLFLFNLFYVPIYLQRMRILKNAQKIEKIGEKIYDHEFIQQSRIMILDIIALWSSKDLQLSLSDNFEDNRVTYELFNQWNDAYNIDKKIIKEAFIDYEIDMLQNFNSTLLICLGKIKDKDISIKDFQNTDDWEILNRMALKIEEELK